MSSDWAYAKLGDLTINLDTNRKPVKESDRKAGPYPYYGASGVVDYVDGYIFDGEYLLIAEDGENLRTRQTPIAFRACGKFWVNNHAHIVAGNHRASTRYLEYAVLGSDITSYLTGAVMPKLTQGNLNRIEVPCPPRAVQDAIVAVLGSLDDRITLLRETNATLEAIAQALFKSWFVDFDPVHANIAAKSATGGAAQGSTSAAQDTTAGVPEAGQRREPLPPMPAAALDAATAALFPDSFEESELGLVPKGWRVGSLSDVCTIASGKRPPDRSDNSTEVCSIPLYGGAGLMGYTSASLFDETLIVTGRVGTLGKVHIAYPPFWASDNVLVVSPKSPSAFSFALNWIRSIDVQALNRGSTQPLLTQRDLGAQQGMIPSREVLHKFEEIVGRLYERIRSQEQQAQTLTQLRDTLLPRLIAGTLRLPEAC